MIQKVEISEASTMMVVEKGKTTLPQKEIVG
jgi:hypothetical protein